MNLKYIASAIVLGISSIVSAQGFGGGGGSGSGFGIGLAGGWSRTSVSGSNGFNGTVTNSYINGGIGFNSSSNYGYGGGYGGYGGYVPYSPFTNTWGNPYYPTVLPYYGGYVPVYPMCGGQFTIR